MIGISAPLPVSRSGLLKEIRQRPAARKSRRLIGGKATAIDPHAHRFAASDNLPAPRGRVGRLAGCHHVVAQWFNFLVIACNRNRRRTRRRCTGLPHGRPLQRVCGHDQPGSVASGWGRGKEGRHCDHHDADDGSYLPVNALCAANAPAAKASLRSVSSITPIYPRGR
jgi:hypothetical protein